MHVDPQVCGGSDERLLGGQVAIQTTNGRVPAGPANPRRKGEKSRWQGVVLAIWRPMVRRDRVGPLEANSRSPKRRFIRPCALPHSCCSQLLPYLLAAPIKSPRNALPQTAVSPQLDLIVTRTAASLQRDIDGVQPPINVNVRGSSQRQRGSSRPRKLLSSTARVRRSGSGIDKPRARGPCPAAIHDIPAGLPSRKDRVIPEADLAVAQASTDRFTVHSCA